MQGIFANLDGIISTEERDNELTGFNIGLSRDEFGVESEDVHLLLEDLAVEVTEHLPYEHAICKVLQFGSNRSRPGLCHTRPMPGA